MAKGIHPPTPAPMGLCVVIRRRLTRFSPNAARSFVKQRVHCFTPVVSFAR